MSYVHNISDISYDHTGTPYSIRVNDAFIDGDLDAGALTVGNINCTNLTASAQVSSVSSLTNSINIRSGTNISLLAPVTLPNSGGSATALSYYNNTSGTLIVTGAYGAGVNYRVARIGTMVSLDIEGDDGFPAADAAAQLIFSTIPADYRPTSEVIGSALVVTGAGAGTVVSARYIISTAGILTLSADLAGANYVIGENAGLLATGPGQYINFSYTRQP